ncbi:hypothetical protein Tco_1361160 [Tanacetum coccineum]
MLSSTGVKLSTSASGSQPSGNTKKDKIKQTPSSTQKNKVEAHPRKVKSSLKNKDCVVAPKGTAYVQHSKLNTNSELKCVKCNGCMLSDNHDMCILDFINNVNARVDDRLDTFKSWTLIKSLKLPKSGNQLRFLIQRVPSGRTLNALSIPRRVPMTNALTRSGLIRSFRLKESATTFSFPGW